MLDPREHRARLLFEQGRFELAQKELVELLSDQPDHTAALVLLALCRLAADDLDEAQEMARRAVGSGPDDPFGHYGLALVLDARRKWEESEQSIREAIRLDPYNSAYHGLLARLRFKFEDWPGCLAAAEAALACDPEDSAALNYRALAQKKLGLTGLAAEQLRAALQAAPEDALTHANLGWTLLEQGDLAKAEEHFREALRLDPDSEVAREGVLTVLRSSSVFYRWWLDYRFWMARQTTWVRWLIIIGLVAGQYVLDWIGSLNPWLNVLTLPLIVLYVLFVFSSILMVPLTNVFLRFHPFGSLVLTEEETVEANGVAALLAATALFWIVLIFVPELFIKSHVIPLAISSLAVLIPFALVNRCEEGTPRQIMRYYTYALAAAALVYTCNIYYAFWSGLLAALAAPADQMEQVLAMADKDLDQAHSYGRFILIGGILATWGINLLNTARWQR